MAHCPNHPDRPAVNTCFVGGKSLCSECFGLDQLKCSSCCGQGIQGEIRENRTDFFAQASAEKTVAEEPQIQEWKSEETATEPVISEDRMEFLLQEAAGILRKGKTLSEVRDFFIQCQVPVKTADMLCDDLRDMIHAEGGGMVLPLLSAEQFLPRVDWV